MNARIRETLVHLDWSAIPVQWGPMDLQTRIGTASFVYEALLNPAVAFVPQVGDDVRIMDDADVNCFFIGQIAQVERGGDPINRRYVIRCQDLNALFDKIRLPSDFVYAAGLDDGLIATDLLTSSSRWGDLLHTPSILIGLVYSTATPFTFAKAKNLPAVTFSAGQSLTDALAQLSNLVGGVVWYIAASTDGNVSRYFHWNDVGGIAPVVLTTDTTPDRWPRRASYFYEYSEFFDRTQHYHRVKVTGNAGLTATADDWVAFADNRLEQDREYGTFHPAAERILEALAITDTTLTTQAAVTQRAYAELNKGRIRKTVRLSVDRNTETDRLAGLAVPVFRPGQLVDVVHTIWGTADVDPVPNISREVAAHSDVRGELMPGARGRYLIQKVTPQIRMVGASTLFRYDLELGDFEGSLAATLARL